MQDLVEPSRRVAAKVRQESIDEEKRKEEMQKKEAEAEAPE